MNFHPYLSVAPEVAEALAAGKPVVALESTIVAHGMPYPENVATARRVEQVVRGAGAIPATIAIVKGKIAVGLSAEQLEQLGKGGHSVPKASRRDLPYLIANGLDGATTVASTMIGAHLAGIKVFVTGGIGGVHRNAQQTFDISADLIELSKTSVAVVCAGAKSILDIGLTLEYLETFGVPVVGYQTDDFPAFYARKSGFGVDCRANSPLELAKIAKAKWDLGLEGGLLVANPVPEKYALDGKGIDRAIEEALAEAEAQRIAGKAVTPFLLQRIKQLTAGESLETNIALVCHNAEVGAGMAVAFAGL